MVVKRETPGSMFIVSELDRFENVGILKFEFEKFVDSQNENTDSPSHSFPQQQVSLA